MACQLLRMNSSTFLTTNILYCIMAWSLRRWGHIMLIYYCKRFLQKQRKQVYGRKEKKTIYHWDKSSCGRDSYDVVWEIACNSISSFKLSLPAGWKIIRTDRKLSSTTGSKLVELGMLFSDRWFVLHRGDAGIIYIIIYIFNPLLAYFCLLLSVSMLTLFSFPFLTLCLSHFPQRSP